MYPQKEKNLTLSGHEEIVRNNWGDVNNPFLAVIFCLVATAT